MSEREMKTCINYVEECERLERIARTLQHENELLSRQNRVLTEEILRIEGGPSCL